MPALSLTDTISDARAQWLKGDARAWTRYVECCLQLEAELRQAQRTQTPVLIARCEADSSSDDSVQQ